MEQIKQGEAAFLGAVVHCAVCVEGVCNSAGCVRTKAKPWPHSRAGPGVTSAALVAPGVPGAALGLRLGSLWDVLGSLWDVLGSLWDVSGDRDSCSALPPH